MFYKVFLFPFSILFFIFVFLKNLFFDLKILKPKEIPKPVVCVGNLTTGGTGKTPWVHLLCDFFVRSGKTPAIVSRGYKRQSSGIMEVQLNTDPRESGEEPFWLKQKTRSIVYVGENRWNTVKKILFKHKVDLILMDDGFQHRWLKKNLNIILLDATAPLSHYFPLPFGRMREGFSSLKRADFLIVNKCNQAEEKKLKKLVSFCRPFLSDSQIFFSDYIFEKPVPLFNSENPGLSGSTDENFKDKKATPVWSFKNKKISTLCAIGNPGSFLKNLQSFGIIPVKQFIFPDHYFWENHEIEKIVKIMKERDSCDLLVTEKDAVKLSSYKNFFLDQKIQVWSCVMTLKLRADKKKFFSKINSSLTL